MVLKVMLECKTEKRNCQCGCGQTMKQTQGRRRIFKSGPAEEAIECRRQERGECTSGGIILPSRKGGLGAYPEIFFEF